MVSSSAAALPRAHDANLHFVTPLLAIGGELDGDDPHRFTMQLAEVCELGVTHVIDTRIEHSDQRRVAEAAPQLRYLSHGIDDAGQRVPPQWFEKAVSWAQQTWSKHPNAVVLAHCQAGKNRGPSLGFALLLSQGWDPVQAIAAIRRARPVADVYYADDALRWHHDRIDADEDVRTQQRDALLAWRHEHTPDVLALIQEIAELRAQSGLHGF